MKLRYDPRYNVAYISLRDEPGEVETIPVGDDLNIDVDADGKVVGIEFLDANSQFREAGGSELVVVNEADGETASLRLAV